VPSCLINWGGGESRLKAKTGVRVVQPRKAGVSTIAAGIMSGSFGRLANATAFIAQSERKKSKWLRT
jgi:hypothetical protein